MTAADSKQPVAVAQPRDPVPVGVFFQCGQKFNRDQRIAMYPDEFSRELFLEFLERFVDQDFAVSGLQRDIFLISQET